MSDTPSPTPAPEAPKPRLSLTPKAPAAPAPAAEAPVAAPEVVAATPPPLQASSGATPAGLLANKTGAARPSLKLSGTPHPSIANPTDAKFETPAADLSSDGPPIAVVALSGIAAVAALTFAALLFLKNQ